MIGAIRGDGVVGSGLSNLVAEVSGSSLVGVAIHTQSRGVTVAIRGQTCNYMR